MLLKHYAGFLYLFTSSLISNTGYCRIMWQQLASVKWVILACFHRLGISLKTTWIPEGLFAAKDFSSRNDFPCHFINPHPKIYWNSATEGKEKEREVEKREKKGREGGRRKTKLRKEILNFWGERTNQKCMKDTRQISNHQSLEPALCAESRSTI